MSDTNGQPQWGQPAYPPYPQIPVKKSGVSTGLVVGLVALAGFLIVGVLAAIAVPVFLNQQNNAKVQAELIPAWNAVIDSETEWTVAYDDMVTMWSSADITREQVDEATAKHQAALTEFQNDLTHLTTVARDVKFPAQARNGLPSSSEYANAVNAATGLITEAQAQADQVTECLASEDACWTAEEYTASDTRLKESQDALIAAAVPFGNGLNG
jgi:hypothetical protein